MTGKRLDSIGIKQVIRLEWMQKAANLMLAGFDGKSVRNELHAFLSDRKAASSDEQRGTTSRSQVVNMIMNVWAAPDSDLLSFRDDALAYLKENPSKDLAIHWAVLAAKYPFWFNVSRQVGRLLNLQEQVTQSQIISRLKEQYGDRETVSRYARSVIRSFVAWGIIRDAEVKGCYKKGDSLAVTDPQLTSLLIEAALYARCEDKSPLRPLLNDPALFPFELTAIRGESVAKLNGRIELIRLGFEDEFLKLIKTKDMAKKDSGLKHKSIDSSSEKAPQGLRYGYEFKEGLLFL